MKNLIVVVLMALPLCGCSSVLVKRTPELLRQAQTNMVQVVVTNIIQREVWITNRVEIPQGTNAAGQVMAPVIQLQPVQQVQAAQVFLTNTIPFISPAIWFTNLSASAITQGVVSAAGELAPVPWGGIVAQGLTALAGVGFAAYNWWGKRKALKEAGVQTDLADTAKSAVDVLVKNVDQVRAVALQIPGYTDKIDANVMKGLKVLQVAAGADVKSLISDAVDQHTKPLSKTEPGTVVV